MSYFKIPSSTTPFWHFTKTLFIARRFPQTNVILGLNFIWDFHTREAFSEKFFSWVQGLIDAKLNLYSVAVSCYCTFL